MRHPLEALAAAVLAAWAVGQPTAAAPEEPASGGALFDLGTVDNRKEPITVNADTLEYDYKNNVVVYRGDVQAAQGEVKLRSDTLTVTFETVKDGNQPKSVDKDGGQPKAGDPPLPNPAPNTRRGQGTVEVGPYGTSTILPWWPFSMTASCARGACASGSSWWMIGRKVPLRSPSTSAAWMPAS